MDEDDEKSPRQDLTRIEDMGEYLHEENGEEEESVPIQGEGEDSDAGFSEDGDWSEGDEFNSEEKEAPEEVSGDVETEEPDFQAESETSQEQEGEYDDAVGSVEEEVSMDGEEGAFVESENAEEAPVEEVGEDLDGEMPETEDAGESATEMAEGEVWQGEEPETGEESVETEQLEEEPAVEEEGAPDELAGDGEKQEILEDGGDIQEEADTGSSQEDFEELRHFADAVTYGDVATRGTPPFTIVINNIRYREDAEGILALLCDHSICTDGNRKDYELGLEQGAVIIPQISEYSAIYLAHKLRRFDVDIQMGLSDEIRPSPSYEREGRGLISRHNIQRNIREEVSLERELMDLDEIVESTSSSPEGFFVNEHFGIVMAHALVEEEDFLRESEGGFEGLLRELKYQAVGKGANGVVSVQYQVTKVFRKAFEEEGPLYKVTCTGDAVGVERD